MNAQRERDAGRTGRAAAALERALRIEPRNPRLWHELARIRCAEGRFDECEGLAERSNGLDPAPDLAHANRDLIQRARARIGRTDQRRRR